jgi:alanine dehydrogenase
MNKKRKINRGVMLLSQKEVGDTLSLSECIGAVEKAYTQFSEGVTLQPPIVSMMMDDRDGEVDVKTGFIAAHNMIGVKVAAGFYKNEVLYGIPSWPSIILLADGETGFPCAVMDGGYITTVRTGAAGAVGAKYLARQESETVLIVGAGNQARIQLHGLKEVLPKLRKVYVYSPVDGEVERYIFEMGAATGLSITGLNEVDRLAEAAYIADVIVTVTPAREPLIWREWVRPGTHINAIGSDGPGKQELDPCILRDAKVVADSFKQTSLLGECQHAVQAGYMSIDGVGLWAEIGEVVSGKKAGRENAEEITVFDATGMAVLDVAVATVVYERSAKKESTKYFQMMHV